MGRHFRKKTGIEKKLWLFVLLLLVVSAAIITGHFIPGPSIPDEEAVPDVVAEQTDFGPDIESTEQLNISADPPGTEKSAPAPVHMPEEPYMPPLGEKPLLAIIVDDGGNQMELTRRVSALELPLTWAIMPHIRFTAETASLADSRGIPYLLHMPMQAQSDKDGSSEYIIGHGMPKEQIRSVTAKALDSLPGAIGLNNHRGSLATSSVEIMEPVIEELKERGLIFVDSRTSEKSVAYNVARVNGVPALRNRGFLDGLQEKNEIEKRFSETLKLAAKRGDSIVICHFRPATVTFLEALAKRKDSLPVRLVTIPEMAAILKINIR